MKFAIIFAALLLAAPASAQDHDTTLDFLVGDWVLYDAAGKQVGSSHVVAEVAGSMLLEMRTADGQPPQALWFENSERDGGWSQLFVGPNGKVRVFTPGSPSGTWPMVLAADVTLKDGAKVRFRVTMTHDSDDRSHRKLEISRDSGASWSDVFDYDYRRAPR